MCRTCVPLQNIGALNRTNKVSAFNQFRYVGTGTMRGLNRPLFMGTRHHALLSKGGFFDPFLATLYRDRLMPDFPNVSCDALPLLPHLTSSTSLNSSASLTASDSSSRSITTTFSLALHVSSPLSHHQCIPPFHVQCRCQGRIVLG